MKADIEKIIVELVQKYLDLPDNYGLDKNDNVIPCVVIKSQNIKLFNTPKLQITIATLSSNVYANRKEYKDIKDDTTGVVGLAETVRMNESRIMQIDAYSRNNEARERLSELQMALSSTLAEQLQDQHQFKIGKISRAINTSGLDGGSDVNRYTIRFNVITWHEKTKEVEYFDKFKVGVYDEKKEIFEIEQNAQN